MCVINTFINKSEVAVFAEGRDRDLKIRIFIHSFYTFIKKKFKDEYLIEHIRQQVSAKGHGIGPAK